MNYFEIAQLAYEEMSLKGFFCFKLWWPFCLAILVKVKPKKKFCEIILKSGHWSKGEMSFKGFLFLLCSQKGEHIVAALSDRLSLPLSHVCPENI